MSGLYCSDNIHGRANYIPRLQDNSKMARLGSLEELMAQFGLCVQQIEDVRESTIWRLRFQT